ncbi:MAG: class B sortase, partial [Clostridia bacterium]|nr:class B sortase [Clostridia bacterium]
MNNSSNNSSKLIIWRIIGIVFVVVALACAVILFLSLRGCEGDITDIKQPKETEEIVTLPSDTTTEVPPETEPVPETEEPIITGELPSEIELTYSTDFAAMKEINPDIHAWIKIPGTPIDYPVLQSPTEELYYERRSYTGDYSISGCIFTQYFNNVDFKDRNTVLYGHYMLDGTFFGSLHNYKDPDFFEKNRYVYITIPGHILVYDIFAAYETDNR